MAGSGFCYSFRKWTTMLMYCLGLGLSGYALYVSTSYEKDPENYKALCDVDESHSCTAAFKSKYSKGFGIVGTLMGDEGHVLNQPNSVYGLVFYSLNFLLFVMCGQRSKFVAELQFYAVILANFMSCYLAYLLYAVLKNMCYVCVATYGVNFVLLIAHVFNRKHLRNKIVPEYSKFERQRSNFPPTLPTFDFKKNI